MSCAKSQVKIAEGKSQGKSKGPMRRYRDGNNNNNSVSKPIYMRGN